MSMLKRKSGIEKRTKLGLALEQSAREILANVKGGKTLPTRRVVLPDEVDVMSIRKRARMSQAEFARALASIRGPCRSGNKAAGNRMQPLAPTSR
jgi:hypothetical protein